MRDKDTQLIFEAYLSEETGDERWDRMRREDPEGEKEYKRKLHTPGFKAGQAAAQAKYDAEHKSPRRSKPPPRHELSKRWELKIAWPNKQGTTTGIGDMSWESIEPPTEDDIREWIKAGWDEHGKIMSNNSKDDVLDPMEFDLRVVGTYGDNDDRGAVGFRKGGKPLHGG